MKWFFSRKQNIGEGLPSHTCVAPLKAVRCSFAPYFLHFFGSESTRFKRRDFRWVLSNSSLLLCRWRAIGSIDFISLFNIVSSLDSWWIELERRTWKDCGICWSKRLRKEHNYPTHSTFLRRQCKLPVSMLSVWLSGSNWHVHSRELLRHHDRWH